MMITKSQLAFAGIVIATIAITMLGYQLTADARNRARDTAQVLLEQVIINAIDRDHLKSASAAAFALAALSHHDACVRLSAHDRRPTIACSGPSFITLARDPVTVNQMYIASEATHVEWMTEFADESGGPMLAAAVALAILSAIAITQHRAARASLCAAENHCNQWAIYLRVSGDNRRTLRLHSNWAVVEYRNKCTTVYDFEGNKTKLRMSMKDWMRLYPEAARAGRNLIYNPRLTAPMDSDKGLRFQLKNTVLNPALKNAATSRQIPQKH